MICMRRISKYAICRDILFCVAYYVKQLESYKQCNELEDNTFLTAINGIIDGVVNVLFIFVFETINISFAPDNLIDESKGNI